MVEIENGRKRWKIEKNDYDLFADSKGTIPTCPHLGGTWNHIFPTKSMTIGDVGKWNHVVS